MSESTLQLVQRNETPAVLLLGNKLSAAWLVKNYNFLELTKRKESGKLRPFIVCKICQEFTDVAKTHALKGVVPLSTGIRVDSQDKLQRVLDHLDGKSHIEAAKAKLQHDLWTRRSESHVWRKFLNDENRELISMLVKLAVDVYNDSLHDTLPAYNWASRSLAQFRGDEIVATITNDG